MASLTREMRMMVSDPDLGAGPSRPARSDDVSDFGIGLHARHLPRSPQLRPGSNSPKLDGYNDGLRPIESAFDGCNDGQRSPQLRVLDGDNPDRTTLDKFWHRAGWLVLLLALQSCSSFILERFEFLIKAHPVIIYFLTMLVGAGGNVGGQSVVLQIRRLALEDLRPGAASGSSDLQESPRRLICTEFSVGCKLALVLLVASAARCEAFEVRGMECLAICLSMIAIVVTSAVLGGLLPVLFKRLSIDPAHAGAALQVAMDGIGVTLTCVVSCLVLGLPLSGHLDTAHIVHAPPDKMVNAIQRAASRHNLHIFGK